MAFARDADYHDRPPRRFLLDRRTGEVLWLYEREEAGPWRFLEIPGLEYGEHAIVGDFLAS